MRLPAEVLERTVAYLRVDDVRFKTAFVNGVDLDEVCNEHDDRLGTLFRLSLVCRTLARIVRREIEDGGFVEGSRLPDAVEGARLRIGSLAVCLEGPWPTCVDLTSVRDLLIHRFPQAELDGDEDADDVVEYERRWQAFVLLRTVTIGLIARDERVSILLASLPLGVDLTSLAVLRATDRSVGSGGARCTRLDELRLRIPDSTLAVNFPGQPGSIADFVVQSGAGLRVLCVENLVATEAKGLCTLVGRVDSPFPLLEHLGLGSDDGGVIPSIEVWRTRWPARLRSLGLGWVHVIDEGTASLDQTLRARTTSASHPLARLTMDTAQSASCAAAVGLIDVCESHGVKLEARWDLLTRPDAMRFDPPQ